MSFRPRHAGTSVRRSVRVPAVFLFAFILILAPMTAFAQESTPEAVPETTDVATAEATEPAAEPTASVDPVQNPNANRIVGSGIAAPLFNALASAAGVSLTTEVTGTNSGLEAFCLDQAGLVLATRPLETPEEEICLSNGVGFQEILIAHSIAAIIVNPEADFADCFFITDLTPIFAPSATATNWNQVTPINPDLALNVVLPPTNTAAYTIIDSLIEGDGLRIDAASLADEAAVASAVSADRGTIGVVGLEAALAAGDTVKIAEIDFSLAGCSLPSAENVEGRLYSAAQPILAYRSFAASADTLTMLNYAVSDAAAGVVTTQGFTFPTADTATALRDALENGTPGRLYTRTLTTFQISPSIGGAIEIGGSANDFDYINNLTAAFTGNYATVTTNVNIEGSVAGIRRLCNGEIDIAVTFAPLAQEQIDNCAANAITPFDINLGRQAVVILRDSADEFATCLTTAQLTTIFTTSTTTWDQIDPTNPATPLFAFTPSEGSATTSLLLITATATNNPGRIDMQINDDPLYRAAATGATSGVISIYSWNEYQAVLDSDQTNVSPVQIDAGNGCIEPSDASITDGSYALTRPLTLTLNRASFAKPQVQSLLWFAISDANYLSLADAGLVGLSFGALPELRATLQETYTQVAVEVAEAAARAAEATAEATGEATREVTSEATSEATSEVTSEPTAEATP